MERRKEGKERGLPEESQLYSRDQWEDGLREPFPEPRVPPPTVCPCSLSLKVQEQDSREREQSSSLLVEPDPVSGSEFTGFGGCGGVCG